MKLGLNIDHIATLREARKINDPDPLEAIFVAKNAGASQITIHLREDRRHINDDDVRKIVQSSFLPVNIECACDEKIVEFLCNQKPYKITLVPEKREEITTEGGLDIKKSGLKDIIKEFQKNDIEVAVFIDPNKETTLISKDLGVDGVEFHTGKYANLHLMLYSNLHRTKNCIEEYNFDRKTLKFKLQESVEELHLCTNLAKELSLGVFAGHGLNYNNVEEIVKIKAISELNIGQSIIARSVFVGLKTAISDMVELIK
ncbi:pyridoxine 5'-phosphate synthase [Helicobacter cappadocius]|uniref:Pyridoxine 5'-phosphate synthase n=1 Tax=Helicobacter cappadocius TaxID=3063998 RepID=A0AA90Q1C1_9HELI|nr:MULTISPECIES: pyridoxine 5'-phosphate synthase [unclassified Helicobacter]MDO7252481.1 pyridoxine 5'-phosphate synthase [Helicobacter sp. faydin-H75]MDP2538348.1 pyridoxine 5'-phosphate synthase [Helicobacter sp. faydin-H76]